MRIGIETSITQRDGVVDFDGGLFVCQPEANYEELTREHIKGPDVVVYSALVSRYKFVANNGEGNTVIHCNPPRVDGQRAFTNGDCVNPGGDAFKNGFQAYIFAKRDELSRLVRPPYPNATACVDAMIAAGGDSNTCFWVFAPYMRGEGEPGKALHFRSDAFAFALRARANAK
jgi:hypothetical protein